jgi:hypothetical protein
MLRYAIYIHVHLVFIVHFDINCTYIHKYVQFMYIHMNIRTYT